MDKKSQNVDKNGHQINELDKNSKQEPTTEKTGYEASDIIEDALQLAVDDELKDDREDINNESGHSSKVIIKSSHKEVNSQKSEDSTPEQMKPLSPPKPETAPVVAPLTIEDKILMDTSKLRGTGTDDASMIVNLDDTIPDLSETEIDGSFNASESNDNKTNRASNNDSNSSDSKSVSVNENMNSSNEEIMSSAKDMIKISEKDSSKSKSSNQRENKVKSKESKNGTMSQTKGQTNSKNNIWVSGLSQNAKACELQTIFSKHGKVVSAKIIKNARMSGSRCFGFITMESSEQVIKCIAQLNKTDLHGRTIALSRNRPQESASKPIATRSKPNSTKRDVNKNPSKEMEINETEEKSDESKSKKSSEERYTNKSISESGSTKGHETRTDKRTPIRAPMRDRPLFPRRPIIPFKRPIPFKRSFPPNSIRGFHRPGFTPHGFGRGGIRPNFGFKRPDIDRNIRERERERRIREERRQREELLRDDIEREERMRFEREKERLKLERMKLEREKAEFFRAEKERARLEREKIEREREELRRRQQSQSMIQHRVDDSRSRSAIVASTLGKRPFESRDMRSNDNYWEERKRIQNIQRIDSHLIPSRQSFVEPNPSIGNRHSIPHSFDTRNDSYKRNTRIEIPMTGNSRTDFETRRHDSRHTIGHDRDERKSTGGPSYYRGDSSRNSSFPSRDRRLAASQRDEWKSGHDSRRSDRYSDKPMTGGSNSGFVGNSRYGSDSRNWSERSSNSVNKMSYGSGNIHMSGSQAWTPSIGGRWNSAISSSGESRSRGQSSHNSAMLSGANPSITELFGSTPMSGIGLNISHSMAGNAGNSLGSGDRPYIHNNRRF